MYIFHILSTSFPIVSSSSSSVYTLYTPSNCSTYVVV